jgi:hypothetical protein
MPGVNETRAFTEQLKGDIKDREQATRVFFECKELVEPYIKELPKSFQLFFEAANHAVEILYSIARIQAANSLDEHLSRRLDSRERAQSAAKARFSSDRKQIAKQQIKSEWRKWRQGETTYRTQAEFARKMQITHLEIQSPKTIEDWIRIWKKEGK